jgi:long-subunit fatty acid transport protein
MTSRFTNPVEVFQSSAQGFFDYRVRTPWRYMASAAAVIGAKGLISAQYEYSNFNQARLLAANRNGSNAIFNDANQIVSQFFAGQNVLRFGGEFRANKNVFLRAGYAWFQNPIPINEALVSDPSSLSRNQYSGGIGYRKASWSLDLSYQVAMVDEPYKVNGGGSTAILSQQLSAIALSMNIRL